MATVDDKVSLVSKYLAMRLETDEKFRDSVKADPTGVLVQYGLPADVVKSSLSDAMAAKAAKSPCVDLTCWSSVCPGTCSVTAISTTTCHCK